MDGAGFGSTATGIRSRSDSAWLCGIRDSERAHEPPLTALDRMGQVFVVARLSRGVGVRLVRLNPLGLPRDTRRTMSQDNVEVLRKAYEFAQSRGAEGFLIFAREDLVWISDPSFPGGGTHMGKENVRRWLANLWIYDEVSIDIEQIIDLDDRALGITRFSGLSHNGPRVDWVWCHLVWFSEGLISQAQSFLDRDSALEAAGLPKSYTGSPLS
jgi:ketosteroid isomerase-like protein